MFHAFKNVISYVVEKRFFVSIQKENHKREIIADSEIQDGSEVFIHRPITIRNDFRVSGKLKIGNQKNIISDENGKILHSKLSKENAKNGDILGFNYGKCMPIQIRNSIQIKPKTNQRVVINNVLYDVDILGKEKLFFDFVLPSTFIGNELNYYIYLISNNKNNQSKTASIFHSIYDSNKLNPDQSEIHKSFFVFEKNINMSDNYRTNLVNENINDFNFRFANKMLRLEIERSPIFNRDNTLTSDIYFLGAKVEFNTNQYNDL